MFISFLSSGVQPLLEGSVLLELLGGLAGIAGTTMGRYEESVGMRGNIQEVAIDESQMSQMCWMCGAECCRKASPCGMLWSGSANKAWISCRCILAKFSNLKMRECPADSGKWIPVSCVSISLLNQSINVHATWVDETGNTETSACWNDWRTTLDECIWWPWLTFPFVCSELAGHPAQ